MKKNMGNLDRAVRILIAIIFSILYFTGTVPGILGIVLLAVGGIFLLTGFVSFCPIYSVFEIKTCRS